MKTLSFRSLRQRIRFAVPVTLFRVVRLGKLESPLLYARTSHPGVRDARELP